MTALAVFLLGAVTGWGWVTYRVGGVVIPHLRTDPEDLAGEEVVVLAAELMDACVPPPVRRPLEWVTRRRLRRNQRED